MARTALLVTTVAALGFQMPSAHADHSWGNYHWERSSTENPKELKLGYNLDAAKWDPKGTSYLDTASTEWSKKYEPFAKVIDTSVVDGGSNPKNCKPTDGRVEVCSERYGFNGWLGLAQIWISGGHITKGIAKLNDSYFDTATYGTPEWRDFVMCQEVGHTFGLDHQDEDFDNDDKLYDNVASCMDYSSDPSQNRQPNGHDYEQFALIYNHKDEETSTVSGPGNGKGGGNGKGSGVGKVVAVTGFEFAAYVRDDTDDWGQAVAFTSKGQPRLFVKDLGQGEKRITHVTWTEDARAGRHFPHH